MIIDLLAGLHKKMANLVRLNDPGVVSPVEIIQDRALSGPHASGNSQYFHLYPLLLGFVPVLSCMHINLQPDRKLCGSLHLLPEDRFYLFQLALLGLDEKLIVNLEDQPGFQLFFFQPLADMNHRNFDDVRRGSLESAHS